ncbi:MAG: hypothetical protein R3B09_28940 [Nannocystaceae bacterium]
MHRRRIFIASLLALELAAAPAAAAPARARGATSGAAPATPAPQEPAAKVDAALKAWRDGKWITVRALLEPLVGEGRALDDPLLTETALRFLADATLLDEGLDPGIRNQLAAGYLARLFAADPEWRPPPDTHGQALYDLYEQMRAQNEQRKLDECLAERASCKADLEDLAVRHERLVGEHEALKKAFAEQEVEVVEKVARNRAIALVPFGVGHFYNGRKGLGAGFLAVEAATGAAGLGLLIYRNRQCEKTGESEPTLRCIDTSQDAVVRRRNAEQVLGIAFISLLALDVLVAQLTFKAYTTLRRQPVKRKDLDTMPETGPQGPGRRRRSAGRGRGTLQARPYPAMVPGGAGVGMSLRF